MDHTFLYWLRHSEILHFVMYCASSALIDTMPAPTKDSGWKYQWAFRWLNRFALNLSRAKSTAVENSPNFQAAVDIQTNKAGLPYIDVKKPEDPKQ